MNPDTRAGAVFAKSLEQAASWPRRSAQVLGVAVEWRQGDLTLSGRAGEALPEFVVETAEEFRRPVMAERRLGVRSDDSFSGDHRDAGWAITGCVGKAQRFSQSFARR